jgi:nucleotide-binding universal stress UspA family protein
MPVKIPHRILMGTDFSDYSKEALDYAVLLAKQFGADLYLLHAFEVPAYYIPGLGGLGGPDIIEWLRSVKEREQKRLETLAGEVRQKGIEVHPILKEGSPDGEILKAVKEVAADLIILGTHGRSGLDRFMMGSVAERVLRQAPCPILLVRPKVFKSAIKSATT